MAARIPGGGEGAGIELRVKALTFRSLVPTFQTLLDSCGHEGVIAPPERIDAHCARFLIQW